MSAKKTDIDAVYKNAFNVDFAKQSAADRKTADSIVAALHTYPHVRTPEQNKLLATVPLSDPQVLRGLGIYSAYRAGSVPDEMGALSDMVRNKAIAAGVPVEKLEQLAGDRQAQFQKWGQGVVNRFAHLAPPPDDAVKGTEASMKVPEKPKPVEMEPMVTPIPVVQPIAQPPAAIAAPGIEGAPAAMPVQPPPMIADGLDPNDPRLIGPTGPGGGM